MAVPFTVMVRKNDNPVHDAPPVQDAPPCGPAMPLTVSRPDLLTQEGDDTFRQLVHNLLAFSARLETVRSSFAAMIGLSGIQYTILISIAHLQGSRGVGIKAVAGHLSLSGAFVTTETRKLITLDLVRKRTNPRDRRRVLLQITDKGRRLLADLAPVQREVNDVLFGSLSREDFRTLTRLARGLLAGSGRAVALAGYLTGATER